MSLKFTLFTVPFLFAEMSKVADIMEAEEIQSVFDKAEATATQVYMAKAVGDDDYKANAIAKLRANFKTDLQRLLRENELKSKDACKTLIEQISGQLGLEGKGPPSRSRKVKLQLLMCFPLFPPSSSFAVT